MYPNFEAEKARKKLTLKPFAEAIGCTESTLSLKLNGKYPLLFKEAVIIKGVLGVDMPLDELFEEGE